MSAPRIFRLSKDHAIHNLYLGCLAVAVGFLLSFPAEPNWAAVGQLLEALRDSWVRLLAVTSVLALSALLLYRKGYTAVAEYVGVLACMAALYPFMGVFMAAIPENLGFKSVFFGLGGLACVVSVSVIATLSLPRLFHQKPYPRM